MPTATHIVQNLIRDKPFLEEAISQGIINYAALAAKIQPTVEFALRKKVKTSAIMMALRRLCETIPVKTLPAISFTDADIEVRSGLFETTVQKSTTAVQSVKKLYDLIDFNKGDFLAQTQGMHEITIISNQRHQKKIANIFSEGTIKTITQLASITVRIPPESVETVGLFYQITKALNWENINIIEIISTLTEMIFILNEKDVPLAFKTLCALRKH